MQNEVEHKQGYHTAYVILFTQKEKKFQKNNLSSNSLYGRFSHPPTRPFILFWLKSFLERYSSKICPSSLLVEIQVLGL